MSDEKTVAILEGSGSALSQAYGCAHAGGSC